MDYVSYFETYPDLAQLVRTLHIELVPDITRGLQQILGFQGHRDKIYADESELSAEALEARKVAFSPFELKKIAFMDRRLLIKPSTEYAKICPTPCWHPDDRPEEPLCEFCLRSCECSSHHLLLTIELINSLASVRGEEEYLPEHFAAAPATAFEVPPPHDEGHYHYDRDAFMLMWRRHRLSVGVDGDEINAEVRDFVSFDKKLQNLARALPCVESLLWACSFAGESSAAKSDHAARH